MSEYQKNNRDQANRRTREYAKRNRGKMAACWAKWNAAKLQATPSWADLDAIEAVYIEAARLTRETGISHHVDPIYPLQSDWCCGLHVVENLQILPHVENVRKSNRRIPGLHD